MKEILSTLFLITFGFTFSHTLAESISYIFKGVGTIYLYGIKAFIARAGIIGLTFILSGIYFFHIYSFIEKLPPSEILIINYSEIILAIFLSMGPYLTYHVSRIVFYLLMKDTVKEFVIWKSPWNNVDIIFVALFLCISAILLLILKFLLLVLVYK